MPANAIPMTDSFYLRLGVEAFLLYGEVNSHFQRREVRDMGNPRPTQTTAPLDELTFQVLRDMRDEVLHELQEGADISDTQIDNMAHLVIRYKFWSPVQSFPTRKPTHA